MMLTNLDIKKKPTAMGILEKHFNLVYHGK